MTTAFHHPRLLGQLSGGPKRQASSVSGRSQRRREGLTALFPSLCGMTYYSCLDADIRLCGPRGIRTPDLLNAIETRSQLRYGPSAIFVFGFQIYE